MSNGQESYECDEDQERNDGSAIRSIECGARCVTEKRRSTCLPQSGNFSLSVLRKITRPVAIFPKTGAFLQSNKLFSSGTFIALTHLPLFAPRAGNSAEYKLLTPEEPWVSIMSRQNTTLVRARLLCNLCSWSSTRLK